ncbi:cryptococcal mannosyltransferase 1-domain-containing protein [Diplogelasinospora grovesii]|uniref:Cryptococcal mannosyltransferase 1-domain-containing protein n=1 Tax=Diplogelasinospora grovesii TaxID=303347 RepID=A0AAN6S139_9PEZI|nr:cryptococcal mannosyltransferase 1-domain-containing protein [Diplogelasinospora grovesii]
MPRKLRLLLLPVVFFLLLAASLYLGSDHLSHQIWLLVENGYYGALKGASGVPSGVSSEELPITWDAKPTPNTPTSTVPVPVPLNVGGATPTPTATILNGTVLDSYVKAILDPAVTDLPRLECPALNTTRYDPLLKNIIPDHETNSGQIDYFFALDLRNCLPLLPRLLGSIVEAIRFLGPERCALSIVEGNSPDGTGEVLAALQQAFLDELPGLAHYYFYQHSLLDPAEGERIRRLAELRNLALQPLVSNLTGHVSQNTTILFLNDVAACTEDILELALQRRQLGADMTCAMDWTYVGLDPTFYDVWIAHTINGDSFFEVPADGNWNSAWNLFWNEPTTRQRYAGHLPFQVFSCWNGATAISAAPLLEGLRFRSADTKKGECEQGEPQLFCKDLWFRGYNKIAVVPSVHLEYSNEAAEKIKKLKGYTGDLVRDKKEEENKIEWAGPPDKVKCMPTWDSQFWRPWNETLIQEEKGTRGETEGGA